MIYYFSMVNSIEEGIKFHSNMDANHINKIMYQSLVESLVYLTNIRLDISYSISYLHHFIINLQQLHLDVAY